MSFHLRKMPREFRIKISSGMTIYIFTFFIHILKQPKLNWSAFWKFYIPLQSSFMRPVFSTSKFYDAWMKSPLRIFVFFHCHFLEAYMSGKNLFKFQTIKEFFFRRKELLIIMKDDIQKEIFVHKMLLYFDLDQNKNDWACDK